MTERPELSLAALAKRIEDLEAEMEELKEEVKELQEANRDTKSTVRSLRPKPDLMD
ncbi:hypothetical protein [Microvirga sp. Mcv34]|uniref:hypothetical protein n=1 Tax=Microvirga sp. Mcv34 TaxID=2926016 RepID=UPI0021C6F04E|nr:hypothetical protein [Microvirga sp. Mcv34]